MLRSSHLLATVILACHVTNSRGAAPVCDLRTIPPPAKEKIKDYAATKLGMLFAASERVVFVWSPSGWQPVWKAATADDKVQSLGVVQGVVGEVLLVGTGEALWEISWKRDDDQRSPWAVFHFVFQKRPIEQKRHAGITAIYRNDDDALSRGYIVDDSGQLIPIQVTTDLRLGKPLKVPGAQPSAIWSRGPEGWSFAWGYTHSTLLVLNPSGHIASTLDLEPVLEPAKTRERGITGVLVDAARRKMYVGSDFGALEGDLKKDSWSPAGPFHHIDALAFSTVETMALVAGRFVAVLKEPMRLSPSAPETNIVIESGGKFRSAVPPGTPPLGVLLGAAAVDSDAIWLETGNQIWQWTPETLTQVQPSNDAHGQNPSIFRTKQPLDRPLISTDLLGETLFACTPPPDFWYTYRIGEGFALSRLVPDPDGVGIWALEVPPEGISDTYGYARLLTAHGALSTTDGTSYGNLPFRISRLSHSSPNGNIWWPVSGEGGVLLPLACAGFTQKMDNGAPSMPPRYPRCST